MLASWGAKVKQAMGGYRNSANNKSVFDVAMTGGSKERTILLVVCNITGSLLFIW